ncbi:iron ABC transporter permease [Paenibacillus sanfengchensis]|uniref:FecCD family ABC transporter permease n=1 Tax=Paenibacillus sanfengchensis TaxID=3119819 RepID=UPI002FE2FE5C
MKKDAQLTYEGDPHTDHKHLNRMLLLMVLIILLLLISVWSLTRGAITVSLKEVWNSLQGLEESNMRKFLYEMRLPNVLIAIFGGMGLAAAGVILQRIMRHPLPDPGTMGMTGGGAFAVKLAALYLTDLTIFQLFAVSTVGSIATSGMVWLLASRVKRGSMAIRSMFTGVLILLIMTVCVRVIAKNTDQFRIGWNFSASGLGLYMLEWLIPWFAVGLIGAFWIIFARPATEPGRKRLMILSLIVAMELSVGVALAFGAIAFVGTVVPLLVRRWVGGEDRWVLPVSVILGAILMVVIGVVDRTLIAPMELPWNFIPSIVGAPIMIYLLCTYTVKEALVRKRQRQTQQ